MALDSKTPKGYQKAWDGGVRPVTGVDLIASERARQVSVEHWTPEHDDRHVLGTLTAAACSYAALARRQAGTVIKSRVEDIVPPRDWPWDEEWWKPSADPIRNLEKAGALIAAEIDRLQRRKGSPL